MSKVNQKYLKDENEDVFSPVISADSVYLNNNQSAQSAFDGLYTSYAWNQQDYVVNLQVYNDTVPISYQGWSLILVQGVITMGTLSTGKAVRMNINNGSNAANHFFMDVRYSLADGVSNYHAIQTNQVNCYLCDINASGNSSYFELRIVNGQSSWFTFKVDCATSPNNSNAYMSSCSGQFQNDSLYTSGFSILRLYSETGLKGAGRTFVFK